MRPSASDNLLLPVEEVLVVFGRDCYLLGKLSFARFLETFYSESGLTICALYTVTPTQQPSSSTDSGKKGSECSKILSAEVCLLLL